MKRISSGHDEGRIDDGTCRLLHLTLCRRETRDVIFDIVDPSNQMFSLDPSKD